MSALSARRVAAELGCSTQPVYRACRSMAELKEAVLERALEAAESYLKAPTEDVPPLLQIGLGSLRFARDEPHLHRAVARLGPITRRLERGEAPPAFVLERMKADPVLAGFTMEQLTRIHSLLWFFSQGVATLFESETTEDPMRLATDHLIRAGQAVIAFEMNRARP